MCGRAGTTHAEAVRASHPGAPLDTCHGAPAPCPSQRALSGRTAPQTPTRLPRMCPRPTSLYSARLFAVGNMDAIHVRSWDQHLDPLVLSWSWLLECSVKCSLTGVCVNVNRLRPTAQTSTISAQQQLNFGVAYRSGCYLVLPAWVKARREMCEHTGACPQHRAGAGEGRSGEDDGTRTSGPSLSPGHTRLPATRDMITTTITCKVTGGWQSSRVSA